ncbi:MAG: hypothetical protein WCR42_02140 [bacterium]
MKKFWLIIAVLFSIILFTNKTKAECPENLDSMGETIIINGCPYVVEICYKCAVTSGTSIAKLGGWRKANNCEQSWTTEEVLEAINQKLQDIDFIMENICPFVLPCSFFPLNQWNYEYIENMCWKKTNEGNGFIYYSECSGQSQYCYTQWRICWDELTSEPSKTLIYGPVLIGNNTCPLGPEPEDPEVNETSDCFALSDGCP